jgi:hypothetical protein
VTYSTPINAPVPKIAERFVNWKDTCQSVNVTNGPPPSKKLCWMRPPPTGPIMSPSGRGHASSQAMALAFAARVVAFLSWRSWSERPSSSIQERKDGTEMCSVTGYLLPSHYRKHRTPLARWAWTEPADRDPPGCEPRWQCSGSLA